MRAERVERLRLEMSDCSVAQSSYSLIPMSLARVYMSPSTSVDTAEVHSSKIPNLGLW